MMRSKERLRQCAAILGLLYILLLDPAIVMSAPLTVNDMHFDGGCYYNLELYHHGEQIRTNEPCLNCTCTNRMLMCYLNTCPYSKPIGSDCEVERMEGQCCPSIKCPEVPVIIPDVLPFVSVGKPPTTTEPPLITTVAPPHTISSATIEHGCFIEDTLYPEGSLLPSINPCELCYCIRNRSACVMQNCTLQIQGCAPNYKDGRCCPLSYDCDKNVTIVPTTTTTALPLTGCYVDDVFHYDGSVINTGGPCEHCYCMKGEVICAVQDCSAPEMGGCTAILDEDHCCPFKYDCPHTELPILEDHTDKVKVDYANTSSSELDVEDREKIPVSSNDNVTTVSPPIQEAPLEDTSTLKDIIHDNEITTELPEVNQDSFELQTTEATDSVSVAMPELPKNVSHEISTTLRDEVEVTTEHIVQHVEVESTTEHSVLDVEVSSSTSISEDAGVSDMSVTEDISESVSVNVSEKYKPETKYPDYDGVTVSAVVGTTTISPDVLEPIDETEESVSPMLQDEPSTTIVAPQESFIDGSSTFPVSISDQHVTSTEGVHKETVEPASSVANDIEEETVSSELDDTTSKPTIINDSSSSSASESPIVTEEVPHHEAATDSPVYDNIVVTESSTELPKNDASEDIATTSVSLVDSIPTNETSEDAADEQSSTTQLPNDKIDIDSSIETQRPVPAVSSSSSSYDDVDAVGTSEKPSTEKVPSSDDEVQSPSDSSVIEVNSTNVLTSEIPIVSSAPADGLDISTSPPRSDVDDNLTTPMPQTSDSPSQNGSAAVDSSLAVADGTQDVAQNRTETTEGIDLPADLVPTTLPPSEETTKHVELVTDLAVGSIPGEGDCYQEGITYKSGDLVVSNNICMMNCTCRSSIIRCEKVACSIPDIVRNMTCRELFEDGKCCPRYICEQTVVGDMSFSSDSLVTVIPSATLGEVEITTIVSDDESDTTSPAQGPSDKNDLNVADSSEEPRTVPPSDTTIILVDDAPLKGTTSPSVAELELTTEPQFPNDVVATEKNESVIEAIPSSSKPPAAVDDLQHLPDSVYETTEKLDEAGMETTASVNVDHVLPSEAKNDTLEDVLPNDLTTIGELDSDLEEKHTTTLPESYDESKDVSTTSLPSDVGSGQEMGTTTDAKPVKDEPILTTTIPVEDESPSTTSVPAAVDFVETEQPLRTDESVVTSGLSLDEAVVDTTPSLVSVDQDLLTTSASSIGPVLDLEKTTMKVNIPDVSEAHPEIITSTEYVLTPEIKRNVTDDNAMVDGVTSMEQSPNVTTDIPQKDESDDLVPEIGYASENPQTLVELSTAQDAVSATSSPFQEPKVTTALPIDDDEIISNTVPVGSIADSTSKTSSLFLDDVPSTTLVPNDLLVEGSTSMKPHVSDVPDEPVEVHTETAADSVPLLGLGTTEMDSVDATVSVTDNDESKISTRDPLNDSEAESTEKVAPTVVAANESLVESSTSQLSDEQPSEASQKPDSQSVTQQTHLESDLDSMETTEHVVDATEKPLMDNQLDSTKKPMEDSVTTSKPLKEAVTTESPSEEVATTERPLEEAVTTEKLLEEDVTTKKPLEDVVTTEKPIEEEVTTEKLLESSVTTKGPAMEMTDSPLILVDSVTTKPQEAEERTDSPSINDESLEITTVSVPEMQVIGGTRSPGVVKNITDKPITSPASLLELSSSTGLPTTTVSSESHQQNVSSSTDKVLSQPLHTISSITDMLTQSSVTLTTSSGHHRPVHVTATPDLLPYPTEDYDDHLDAVYPDAGVPITSENFTLKDGDCIYESRLYSSAQQIPRNDPCDFCFCFRGDIICLQQSCPPPIEGCFEESIPGFCCPRYECPVTAVTINVTDSKAPPYPVTANRYRTVRALTQVQVVVCEFRNKFYNKGEFIASASGPCMDCMCGEKGTMKCTPKTCQLDPLWHTLPNLRKFNKLDSSRVGRNRF